MNIDQQIKAEIKKKERRKGHVQSMKYVLSLPTGSSKRWRAAYEHFLRQRPEAALIARQVTEYNVEKRKMMDKFGDVKMGRLVMSAPPFLEGVIRLTDPEYFLNTDSIELTKPKHLRKLQAAFPEYFLPKEI